MITFVEYICNVLFQLLRNNREGKEGMFTRENSTGSNYFIDESTGVRLVTLVEPRPSPQLETIRRAQ